MPKPKKESKSKSPESKASSEPKAAAKPPAQPARVIDTTHAAEAAAAMVVSGMTPTAASPASRESASFKHLKESLSKPASTLGNALDKSGLKGGKHSHLPFGHATGKQVGRNQTFGADVNRTGVPRRTGG